MLKTTLKRTALVVIWLVLCLAAYFVVVDGPLDELDRARSAELGLRQELGSKHEMAVNLESYRKQLEASVALLGTVRRILPDERDVTLFYDKLLGALTAAAARNGVKVEGMAAGDPTDRDFYVERRARIKASGSFRGLVRFLHGVLTEPEHLLLVKGFVLEARESGAGLLLGAELEGFGYLDEDAVAARRKQLRERGKAEK